VRRLRSHIRCLSCFTLCSMVAYLIGACNVGLRRSLVGPSFISCTLRPCLLLHKHPTATTSLSFSAQCTRNTSFITANLGSNLRTVSQIVRVACSSGSHPPFPGVHTRRALAPGSAVPPSGPMALCVRLPHPSTLCSPLLCSVASLTYFH
jgi:hypothetical protein